jgi:tRNA-2-methylthio-N6-dimethylallyladenosine synthase
MDIISAIREKIADIAITTDILLGFPGETEEDFRKTLNLMESANFDDSFIYRYNPREGTAAFKLGDPIPYEVKIRRMEEAFSLQKELSRKNRRKRLGRDVRVLVEGALRHGSFFRSSMVVSLCARGEPSTNATFPPKAVIAELSSVKE